MRMYILIDLSYMKGIKKEETSFIALLKRFEKDGYPINWSREMFKEGKAKLASIKTYLDKKQINTLDTGFIGACFCSSYPHGFPLPPSYVLKHYEELVLHNNENLRDTLYKKSFKSYRKKYKAKEKP